MTSSVSLLRTVCIQYRRLTLWTTTLHRKSKHATASTSVSENNKFFFAATATFITLFRDKVESGFLVECNLKAFNCHPALAQLYYERFCLAASIHYHLALMSECTTDEWLYIHQKIISSENGRGSKSQNCTFKGQIQLFAYLHLFRQRKNCITWLSKAGNFWLFLKMEIVCNLATIKCVVNKWKM